MSLCIATIVIVIASEDDWSQRQETASPKIHAACQHCHYIIYYYHLYSTRARLNHATVCFSSHDYEDVAVAPSADDGHSIPSRAASISCSIASPANHITALVTMCDRKAWATS